MNPIPPNPSGAFANNPDDLTRTISILHTSANEIMGAVQAAILHLENGELEDCRSALDDIGLLVATYYQARYKGLMDQALGPVQCNLLTSSAN